MQKLNFSLTLKSKGGLSLLFVLHATAVLLSKYVCRDKLEQGQNTDPYQHRIAVGQ